MNVMKKFMLCLLMTLGFAALRAQDVADSLSMQAEELSAVPEPAAPAEASADGLWDRANTAYINGDYHTAENLYEQLLARGLSSAKLYYNLGNACFKADHTGRAVLNYMRALRLAPGSEDVRYNLRVAEARTKDTIEDIPEFFLAVWLRGVRRTMSCTAWSVLSLAMLVCALSLFLIYLLASRLRLRKTGFYGTLAALLLFAVATAFASGERREMLDDSKAVVMSPSAAVKSSPGKAATDLFVLHEGTVVTVLDRLDEWCEISIADGKKGWIESRTIETV